MSLSVLPTRSRIVALTAGLALSLSVGLAPAAMAQGDPTDAVDGLIGDITAGNFEDLGMWFCPEFADQADSFDFTSQMPPGTDGEAFADAITIGFDVSNIETLSQTDTEAVVQLDAVMSFEIDVDALDPVIESLLEAGGQEVTPDMVELVKGMMATELAGQTNEISEQVTVVPRPDGTWGLVCSPLGGPDMTDDETDTETDSMTEDGDMDAGSSDDSSDGSASDE